MTRAVRGQREAFKVRVVLIEDQASSTRLIQEPVADGLRAVTRSRTRSCACRPDEDSARPGRPRAPNRLLSSSRYYQKAIFHGEKGGDIGAQKGTNLISSRAGACAPAVLQQGFWFTPQAEPKV